LPLYYAAALVTMATLFFGYLPTGRRMYATGGNRAAAHLSGVHVDRLIFASFITSACLSGAAGVIIAARLGSAQPGLGPQFLLPAFAAAFLGATAIRPGRFNVVGTVIAVYVLAVPISGLQQLGVPSWFEPVFNGAALVVAVALSNQIGVLREARARRERLRAIDEMRDRLVTEGGDAHA
jgi:ribose transport system permease protein